ncbi:lipase member H-like isoform X1 [Planococcus citri]|uniref:lipase member H-like isoform X1 n=2 Tax=Planococcus citri TaxID=170843 RepID=UPI0031F7F4D0
MRWISRLIVFLSVFIIYLTIDVSGLLWDSEDSFCVMRREDYCPDKDIRFYLYTSEQKTRREIDTSFRYSLLKYGWNPNKKNVIVIHGFNGTESKSPMTIIRDAYLNRGDYNVFTVDWSILTFFPCYLSSLSNTRLVAQCTAQFYSHLTYNGASAFKIHCVGHSLGAHICGMMSNHLSHKMHKIIGLDPARPLVDRYGSDNFRLTKNDANFVQVIHTNAGLLGETPQIGHVDFCVNGGTMQPSCQRESQIIRRSRCSHFMSACFFAATVTDRHKRFRGLPCTTGCRNLPGFKGVKGVAMGEHTPENARGIFCLRMMDNKKCPFD